MLPQFRTGIKKQLSRVLPDSMKLRYLSYLPRLETFRKSHTEEYPIFGDRYKMYDYINGTVIDNLTTIYCEFGVFEGATIKYWTKLNQDINSRFYGFDTFTGLPEAWGIFSANFKENSFDAGGKYPQIDDERVWFIKGLFQDTLPGFLEDYNSNDRLIIHNDSDLYSSTLYVLTAANEIIVPGTIIIFDEFSSILHEFRALEDYCSSYLRRFEVVAATISPTNYFRQIAIEMK